MTSPDCVSAGLGIDVAEAEEVPNVRDLFEAAARECGVRRSILVRLRDRSGYRYKTTEDAFMFFQAGYRAAGGQGA